MLRTRRLPAINSDGRGRRVNKEICTWRKVAGEFHGKKIQGWVTNLVKTSC